jgi:hypothetical protein
MDQNLVLSPQRADFYGAIPRVSIGTLLNVDIFNHQ